MDGVNGVDGKRGDGNRGAGIFTWLGKMFFRTGEKFAEGNGREWRQKKGILTDLMKEDMLESSIAPLIFTTFCSYVIQNSYLCSLI